MPKLLLLVLIALVATGNTGNLMPCRTPKRFPRPSLPCPLPD